MVLHSGSIRDRTKTGWPPLSGIPRVGRCFVTRIRRRSGLHHTRNAHAHCPSEPPGSSIPIGRKPSQPPRPSGLPHCLTYNILLPNRERERDHLSPLRRRPSLSLSSPLHVCAYTHAHIHLLFLFAPVFISARAPVSLLAHAPPRPLCAHPTYLPTYPSFLCDRPLSYSVPFPARGTGRVSPTWMKSVTRDSAYPSRKQREREEEARY